jgi:hypothetical protein
MNALWAFGTLPTSVPVPGLLNQQILVSGQFNISTHMPFTTTSGAYRQSGDSFEALLFCSELYEPDTENGLRLSKLDREEASAFVSSTADQCSQIMI